MVVRRISDTIDKWIGLSTDVKPDGANIGSYFITEDNNDVFVMLKTGWSLFNGGGDGELAVLVDGSRDVEGPLEFTFSPIVGEFPISLGDPMIPDEEAPTFIGINLSSEIFDDGAYFLQFQEDGEDVFTVDEDGAIEASNLLISGGQIGVTGLNGIEIFGTGNLATNGGHFKLTEMASPPAVGTGNAVLLYAEDNGAGKTKLMAKFPTGSAVQISVEP